MTHEELEKKPRFVSLMKAHPAFSSYAKHLRRKNRPATSIETYLDCLRTLAEWLDDEGIESPTTVGAEDLERFRVWLVSDSDRQVSKGRQGTYVAVLRSFYRFLFAQRQIMSDPTTALRSPKVEKRIPNDVLAARVLQRLIEVSDDSPQGFRDRIVLRLLALSGPRVTELSNVDVEHVDVKQRELVIRNGKGAKDRLTFIDRETQSLLARYLTSVRPVLAADGERALIVNDNGGRAASYTLRRIVKRHGARVRKAITPHSLRRTFCTLMHRAGANLKVIGELAGHKRLSTTTRYTKVDIEDLSRVYAAAHPRATEG